ncbi:hypothetical protein N7535_003581 [Penicillium sp. DV-2018c]|nr:hypothetical protein N7461_000718 [Penicillium sp. DV-2018c]KAJ5576655.1 hypothetical protein N7535_003581 [Penicillium sp. DV-2018c]
MGPSLTYSTLHLEVGDARALLLSVAFPPPQVALVATPLDHLVALTNYKNQLNETHPRRHSKKEKQKETSPGRLELPTSRLTVGRANQLRHGDLLSRTAVNALMKNKKETSPGRLELPTSRLTVGRANQLRHGDVLVENPINIPIYKPKPNLTIEDV